MADRQRGRSLWRPDRHQNKENSFFFFTRLTPSFFVPFLIDIICLRFSHSAAQKKKNSNREVV